MVNPEQFDIPQNFDILKITPHKEVGMQQVPDKNDPLKNPPPIEEVKQEQANRYTISVQDKSGPKEVIHDLIITVKNGKISSLDDSIPGAAFSSTLLDAEFLFDASSNIAKIVGNNFETSLKLEEQNEDLDLDIEIIEIEDDDSDLEIIIEQKDVEKTVLKSKIKAPSIESHSEEWEKAEAIFEKIEIGVTIGKAGVMLLDAVENKIELIEAANEMEVSFDPDDVNKDFGLEDVAKSLEIAELVIGGAILIGKYTKAANKTKNQIPLMKLRIDLGNFKKRSIDAKEKLTNCNSTLLKWNPEEVPTEIKEIIELKFQKYEAINDKNENLLGELEKKETTLLTEMYKTYDKEELDAFVDLKTSELICKHIENKIGMIKGKTKHAYREAVIQTLKESKTIASLAGKTVATKVINVPIQIYNIAKHGKAIYKLNKKRKQVSSAEQNIHHLRMQSIKKALSKKKQGIKANNKGKINLLGLKQKVLINAKKAVTFGVLFKSTLLASSVISLLVTPFGIAAGLGALGIIAVGGAVSTIATGGALLLAVIGISALTSAIAFLIYKNRHKIAFHAKILKKKLEMINASKKEKQKFKQETAELKSYLKYSKHFGCSPQEIKKFLDCIEESMQDEQEFKKIKKMFDSSQNEAVRQLAPSLDKFNDLPKVKKDEILVKYALIM